MILYYVWFSFKNEADETAELAKTRHFLDDLQGRSKLHGYRLLRNRATKEKSKLHAFQLIAEFTDNAQFTQPFAEVNEIGIHSGRHGTMIENVGDFMVEIFEDI